MSQMLQIRLFLDSDLDLYLRWSNQEEIWRVDNSGAYALRTPESFARQWRKIVGWERSWMILVDKRPIGYVGFVSDDADALTDEFFIVIGEIGEWGKGHGKAAMRWLFGMAAHSGLHKITGKVLSNNHRALTFYGSLGFTVTGSGEPRFERDGRRYETVYIERQLVAHGA